jgi:hypothetical protein
MKNWQTEYQQYPDGAHICVADSNGDWIADCGNKGNKESEANARLIASAPELLETLKEVKQLLAGYLGESETAMSTDYKALERAEQIIAKAEGRGV